MATVYLAEDVRHRRQVAVKVLRPELAASLGTERFLREIDIAAGLRHPHIVPLFDSGDAPARGLGTERTDEEGPSFLYYVMPLVEGETLRNRLTRERQLPVDEALRIAGEVADALSYAHARGIVHRDIKPENILLDAGHAVVADFGIARAVAASDAHGSLTATGVAVGTPAYMSPEQAAGERDVDARSDIYSLACVTYEMLAGQPPFTGATTEALVRQHLATTPTPVSQIRPTVSPAITGTLARALAKAPADRFSTATQFAASLAQRHDATTAPAIAGRAPRRSWLVAGVLAVALAAALGAWARSRWGSAGSSSPDAGGGEPAVAVLPFESIAGDTASDPLALGVHAEVITQLAKLGGLRLASRGSTLEYQGSRKRQRDIASELGVTTLLTGSVQRSGRMVHVTMDLAEARSGRSIWAESYDRELTAENIFAVQADIARQVATALRLRLTAEQQTALARAPTTSLAALDRYHRALIDFGVGPSGKAVVAAHLLEEAVSLDSGFVDAWSLLARVRSYMLRSGEAIDTTPALRAVERTGALAPGSLEHRLALGYYRYYAHADFEGALQQFQAAERLAPGSADILTATALVLRRLGRWDETVAYLERARALGPRDVQLFSYLGDTYLLMRRWDDAQRTFDAALAVEPTGQNLILHQFDILIAGRGDTARARAFAATSASLLGPEWVAYTKGMVALMARHYAEADTAFGTYGAIARRPFSVDFPLAPTLGVALARRYAGDDAGARRYADSTLVLGERELVRRRGRGSVDLFGTQAIVEVQMAAALAIKGQTANATALAERAASRWPVARDAADGGVLQEALAGVYVLAGRPRDAVATLEALLAVPANTSVAELRLDPLWDPLRGRADFQALLTSASPR